MNKLFLIELFGGIGSQAKALKNLGINFEHYRLVEWDKYAIKSYNAIHNTNFTTTDIRQIKGKDLGITNTNQKNYLLTYSFPCTDLSKAGKMKGMSKGSNTRSGLLWEVERLLNELDELPQYLLMENVPDVIGQKNIKDFADWVQFLENLGYKNYYECLNAKDYGIPQNRNRCFMVSFLDKRHFTFPKPFELKLRLLDMLEDSVEERYFLSDNQLVRMRNTTYESGKLKNRPHQKRGVVQKGMIQTLKTSGNDVGVVVRGNYSPSGHNASRIVDKNGLAPTVMENHGTVTAVVVKPNVKNINNENDVFTTLGTNCGSSTSAGGGVVKTNLGIRKLTPKECWRLMGFSDDDFDKASKVNSNSQLYKQAGNSIVVNVLMEIFKKMFIDTTVENYQTNLFDFI